MTCSTAKSGAAPRRWQHFGADKSTIITELNAGTRYEVQVRARSDEGTGDWSRWGSGSPNPDVANRHPRVHGWVTDVERGRKHAAEYGRGWSDRGDRP